MLNECYIGDCREERYAAMERRHELELLEDPIPESGIVQPERERE